MESASDAQGDEAISDRAASRGNTARTAQGYARQAWDWGRHIATEFRQERANLTAAAIALFGLLSTFPLVLLALAGATYALGSEEEALDRIGDVLQRFLVGGAGATIMAVIRGVVETRGIASFIGLLGFVWAASRVFTILIQALDMAWDVSETRGFLKLNLIAIGLVFVALLFGVVIFVAPLAVGLIIRYSGRVAEIPGVAVGISGITPILVGLAAYAATIALFFILYRYLPNRKVHWQSALLGAVVAGSAWEVVRYLFHLYLVNFASYNEVYGALAGVIILILWLYYSAMIVLAGAITSAVHGARVFHDRAEHPESCGFDERGRRAT